MSKYFIVVPPFYGHITATLGIGKELLDRGHEVFWIGLSKINTDYLPQKAKFIIPEEVERYRGEIKKIQADQNKGFKLKGKDSSDFNIEQTLLPFCDYFIEGLEKCVRELKPDCIIHDESALAGAVVAHQMNIPYITTITVPPGFFESDFFLLPSHKEIQKRMMRYQQSLGIHSDRLIFNSSELVLSFTSEDILRPFYKDYKFANPITFVGSTIEKRTEPASFDWNTIQKNRILIYVSIGTVLEEVSKSFFTKIIEDFRGSEFTVIVNTDPSITNDWPENFIVQKVCPQIEILSKVDLVITHGGFNTVNEALFFDKPMITVPLAWDQFGNSDLLLFHKCAIKLRFRRLKKGDFYNAAKLVTTDPLYAKNAEILGKSLRKAGGTIKAADLIEEVTEIKFTEII